MGKRRIEPHISPAVASGDDSLGRKTGRGALVTVGGQWSRTLIQLLSIVILARLLTPADFGMLAMVTAIVGIAEVLRDFGLTASVLQRTSIDDRLWSVIFWLSAALGILCALIIAALAPFVALLYGDPRLVAITIALAPTVFLNSMNLPYQTKLQRSLRFGAIALADILSMAVGVALSIFAALLGWGVWSLVVLYITQVVVRLLVLSLQARLRPGRPRIGREAIPLLRTGSTVFGSEMLSYLSRNLDNVAVGSFASPAVLGYYTRAYSILLLPLTQINGPLSRVALPVLSSLRDQPARFRRYTSSALLVISYASLSIFAIAAAVAEPLIFVFLGPNWAESVPIFQLLAIGGIAQSLDTARSWLYIALRRTGAQLVLQLCTKPILIASFFVGMFYGGVLGMALLSGLVSLVLLVPGFYFAIKGTFVKAADVVWPFVRPLTLTPFMFLSAYAAQEAVQLPPILEILVGAVSGVVPLALAALLFPPVRRDMRLLVEFARKIKPMPKST